MPPLKKVLIFSDSESLPRGKSWGDLPFETVYPYLLDRNLRKVLGENAPFVIDRGRRFRTVTEVLEEWEEEVELKRPEVLVLQVGGNDCAPRFLLPRGRERIRKIPLIGALFSRFEPQLRNLWLRWAPLRTLISEKDFRDSLLEITRRAEASKVQKILLMSIMPISSGFENALPGMAKQAERYNKILFEMKKFDVVEFVDLHTLVQGWGGPEKMTLDGMHLTREGHSKLATILADRITLLSC